MKISLEKIGKEIPLMVFDVESIGLHGEGYAVGYVVFQNGEEVESDKFVCSKDCAAGWSADRNWVDKNIPDFEENSPDTYTIQEKFWQKWMEWKNKGAVLAADCQWPVESRFLCSCIDNLPADRSWDGPYPFIEISSILLAADFDPLGTFPRFKNELPAHDPLTDARQSARLLFEAIEYLN